MVDTITYRTTDNERWGAGKGSNLTPVEVDLSFWSVHVRLDALETAMPSPVEISQFLQVGAQFFVEMEDSTQHGPFTLPRAVAEAAVVEVTGTSKTLALSDSGTYNRCTHASGCIVTVPADDEVDWLDDTEVHFRQCSVNGHVSLEAPSGVIINGVDGYALETDTRGAVVTLKKVGPDEWDLFGLLAIEQVS